MCSSRMMVDWGMTPPVFVGCPSSSMYTTDTDATCTPCTEQYCDHGATHSAQLIRSTQGRQVIPLQGARVKGRAKGAKVTKFRLPLTR